VARVWTLTKTFRFEAAHKLPKHDGKCARLHGHSWACDIEVRGPALHAGGAEAGMVIDYGTISGILRPLVDGYLDHHYLNDTLPLDNPTSEEVARWLYQRVKPYLAELTAVTIHETCTARCRYEGE
jgi:6-pyruvoyltetrahydropterin/6-carboxytetrahydropterin synthase